MTQAEADRALMKFMTITDRVGQFEARVNTPAVTSPSIHTSRVRLEQIRALWDKVEKEYEACSEALSGLGSTDTITVMQSKYDYCYAVYERCAASLNEIIEEGSRSQQAVQASIPAPPQGGCRLPPVECDSFSGDYVHWPTFRDLFSAIYIHNPRLSEVEKLFHLNAKTSGLNLTVAAQPRKRCQLSIGSPVKPHIQIKTSAYVLPQLAGSLPSFTLPEDSLKHLPPLQLADPNFYRSSQIDVLIGADILPSIILSGSHPNICGTLLGQETIFGWILCVKRVRESTSICEENFVQSTKRNEDGRSVALAQFLRNEIRLNKDVVSKKQYDSVIQEYLDLGHMHQVSPDDSNNFYLPHHAVFKPDSTTTKVRVVFNASNPSSNGNSLNDILHAGPVLQSDLTIQILKWRFFKILFRNKDGELCDYELDTVTFGVNCAPFLAIRVLQQLAQDIRGQYPLASDIISNFMYVDDVLAGTHTKQSAVLAIEELRLALESAGFPLRKWTSNERKLLQEVPKEHLISADFLELEEAIRAKIFMQKIWLRELGWDQPLPRDLATQWREFLEGYPALKEIRIPRWVRFHPAAKLQYHAFCDASQDAYGAAIFVRIETKEGCCTHLLTSKTRVAPVRSISIVLAWLSKPACTWTTFVANRVAKIEQCTGGSKWGHVRSEDNPADLASRGVSPQELKDSALWWRGPAWLHLKQEQWPSELLVHPETELEQRPVKCHTVAVPSAVEILERFSAFDRALRVLAYVFRFVKSCRREGVASSAELTAAELSEVQERLIVLTQKNEFPAEYKVLSNKQPVPPASAISNLNPFLDGNGVLRASGRLQASEMLSYDEKHPIILPARCRFAELQVLFIHRISLHGGNQLMIRLIRSKFWIPKLKMLVKRTIHSCRVCVIHKKRLQTQLMGNLPRARSTFSRPFTHTGVDFAGPFDVKSYVGRACKITKGYVCVFVCFTTRAIHLEATSDLTTEKFLAAFSRFFARRGCPQHVYSDNGKTFVGASTSLSKDFIEATRTSVLSQHSLQNVSWHFNPPGAPHMGGLWEAGVKSFKSHFYKYTAAGKYTFEELTTLLAKIEACLNSRPISPMSEDPRTLSL
ncbi:uncharacterized protein LOC122756464 [Drosophila santomea]|uniref:uncharacterized protein LOC122756464 n=1 Tax=Drosophila santomea TaxID=129105 RepID=UPI001CC9BA7A|nr:uncharacterized protein LOC122756464 [Drosophila santomea]